MGRAFGLVLLLVSLYLGARVYGEGLDSLLGRVTAPIQGTSRDAPLASGLSDAAGMADAVPTDRERRVWITEQVREQVNADLARGARRHGD